MKAFCLFADVYGFSARINESNLETLSEELKQFNQAITTIIERRIEHNFELIQFSDSFFLTLKCETGDISALEDFLHVCGEIYEKSFSQNLPIRGCVTFGNVVSQDNALLGIPIIQAALFEKDMNLPILAIPMFVAKLLEKDFDSKSLWKLFPPPIELEFQNGLVSVVPIMPANSSSLRTKAISQYEILSCSYNKAKPALAWKRLIELLESSK